MNRIKIFSVTLGVLGLAGLALAVEINTNIPTPPGGQAATGLGGFVNNFYMFALMISGVLAFGAIVYGGIKYTLAAGNPSGQSEGKEWVKGALIGLLLLAGAYTILNIINPNLTTLAMPTLTKATVPSVETTETAQTTCLLQYATLVWKDGNNGNIISSAKVGDTVYMDATINGDCSGENETNAAILLYEHDTIGSDDQIGSYGPIPIQQNGNYAIISQKISLTDQLYQAGGNEVGSETLYFKVGVLSDNKQSPSLTFTES